MIVLSIAWKDIQIFVKERGSIVMLFLLPLIFVVTFSAVFSMQFGDSEKPSVPVVNLDPAGNASIRFIEDLAVTGGVEPVEYSIDDAGTLLESGEIEYFLVIPSGFSDNVSLGSRSELRLEVGDEADSTDVEAMRRIIDGVAKDLSLQSQLISSFAQMGEMMSLHPESEAAFSPTRIVEQAQSQFDRARHQPLVSISRSLPDVLIRERESFDPVNLSVPGFAVLFVFLTATTAAMSLHRERKTGSYRRLLCAPVGRMQLLSGKLLPSFLTTLSQIVVIFAASRLLLPLIGLGRVSLAHPVTLLVISVVISLCSTSLGLFLGAVARTESQINTVGSVVLWIMGAVSGAFIPSFFLGDFLGTVGKAVPHYWAISAYQEVLVRGRNISGVADEIAILLGFTVLFFAIGMWRFRFAEKGS
jgi:ABC-2 type transport system permease protein